MNVRMSLSSHRLHSKYLGLTIVATAVYVHRLSRLASYIYCQTEVLGMQSMRRRRHAHIHDLKSRYVENISLFHAYARKNNIWILDH